jgi:hypothetical protein
VVPSRSAIATCECAHLQLHACANDRYGSKPAGYCVTLTSAFAGCGHFRRKTPPQLTAIVRVAFLPPARTATRPGLSATTLHQGRPGEPRSNAPPRRALKPRRASASSRVRTGSAKSAPALHGSPEQRLWRSFNQFDAGAGQVREIGDAGLCPGDRNFTDGRSQLLEHGSHRGQVLDCTARCEIASRRDRNARASFRRALRRCWPAEPTESPGSLWRR